MPDPADRSGSGSQNPPQPVTAPYGTWLSPVTARQAAAGTLRLRSVAIDGDDIYWLEGRPEEAGRQVVVRRSADGRIADATPAETNVRTRVHEYGGGTYVVDRGTIYYSEFADHRVYRLRPGETPTSLTAPAACFYADLALHPSQPWLVCVREDHTAPEREAVNTLVVVHLDRPQETGTVIASGFDFYSTPRFSPDGRRLSWLAWRHPNMPWDGTELWVAEVAAGGTVAGARRVAGGDTESVFQPGWSPDGTLYFVSDRTDWWNLYRLSGTTVEPVCPMSAEFGRPQWVFGLSTWSFAGPDRLVVAYGQRARWHLATLDAPTGALEPIGGDLQPSDSLAASGTHAVCVVGSALAPEAVVRVDLATGATETLRASSAVPIDPAYVSTAEAIEFPTEGGLTAHAFYLEPRNRDFVAPPTERPPLMVLAHGGPTAATTGQFNPIVQYWTSRGFAVVDVNYGGSTGFGRAYRQRLNGQWGVVDVIDCINAARFLVREGRADPRRLIVRGSSAGGYVALAALTFHPEVFSAGASYYGIGDIEAMARTTHKFESRYFDSLLGPLATHRDLYRARSPVHSVDRLSSALILFQGLEDKVVPPAQSQIMADAARAKGLPVTYLTFEGEQHGFRKAETVVRCLEAELAFYGAVFAFASAAPRSVR